MEDQTKLQEQIQKLEQEIQNERTIRVLKARLFVLRHNGLYSAGSKFNSIRKNAQNGLYSVFLSSINVFFDYIDKVRDFELKRQPTLIISTKRRIYHKMEDQTYIEVEDAKQEFDLLKNCELNFDNYSLTNL